MTAPEPVGCCAGCRGTGGGGGEVSNGVCWDCRGTGCAHPEPHCTAPEPVVLTDDVQTALRRVDQGYTYLYDSQCLAREVRWLANRLAAERAAHEAQVARLVSALTYISSPTMGLPAGADALDFAMEGATEHNARYALQICIRSARAALSATVPTPPQSGGAA